jgi:hypothetical protein
VAPGGGLSPDGERWVACRPRFFFPVKVLSLLFRRLFLESLQKAFDSGELRFFNTLEPLREGLAFTRHLARAKSKKWVVYAKAPFAGPQQVLDYVGRYTHRVAISNNRLLDIDNGEVRFRWKDYRDGDQIKTMTLSADEFIRRFLLHVLPNGLQRIRYYGFLGNRNRQEKLEQCRRLIGMPMTEDKPPEKDYRDLYEDLTGRSLRQCPRCQQGRMVIIAILPRSPFQFQLPVIELVVNHFSNNEPRAAIVLDLPVQRRSVVRTHVHHGCLSRTGAIMGSLYPIGPCDWRFTNFRRSQSRRFVPLLRSFRERSKIEHP